MGKQLLFIFLSTLLPALLLTGCGSDQNTVSENAIPEESAAGHIAPISDLLVIEACEELSSDPSDYLLIADGTDISQIQLHFEEVDSLRNGDYPVSASYGEERVEFTIQIEDTIPPVITAKSENSVFPTCDAISAKDLVDAWDLTGISHIYYDTNSPGYYYFEGPGEYEVKISAYDSNYNSSTITITVTIEPLNAVPRTETAKKIQDDPDLPQIYKDYLLGNETAIIGKNVDFADEDDFYTFNAPLLPGKSASIQDICDMIESGDGNRKHYITGLYYSMVDCGMDGKPELAVCYYYYHPGDSRCMTTVLCEEKGNLVMKFSDTYNARSYLVLFQDGCYVFSGSGGATHHYSYYYILDSSVNPIEIDKSYIESDYLDIVSAIDEDRQAMLAFYGHDTREEMTYEEEQNFQNMMEGIEVLETCKVGTKSYFLFFPYTSPSNEEPGSLAYYLYLCQDKGTFLSTEEYDQVVADYISSLGISWETIERTKDDEEVDWQPLLSNHSS